MREKREVDEAKEVKEVDEKSGGVAAFFDLDGTLLGPPSMEKRFYSLLRYRRVIGIRNGWWWMAESARLAPRGINQILHANKMYLRGVCVSEQSPANTAPFLAEAMERVAWHVQGGHSIVIVSGTLEALAEKAARGLESGLLGRGWATRIGVCATRLEEAGDRWTGRIVGEAMFGEAKARAIKRIAAEMDLDLERCFAYGDSASDRWMLEAVGKPAAVNPSHDLARIARRNDWPILCWEEKKDSTQRTQSTQSVRRKPERKIVARIGVAEEVNRGDLVSGVSTDHLS
ncbi:MAG TPA: HAD-IB family hydrolase [Candidatus Solibacter sp.]|nr:HAD-IB family hydrolase [Candidatus Solibacter sp.]